MVVVLLAQSFFIVKQHEVGLVYRFGALRDVLGTGLHLVWPFPFESTEIVEISRSRQLESRSFMFTLGRGGQAAATATLKPGSDGFLLSADRNIVHAKCTLTYYVDNSSRKALLSYHLLNADAEALLQELLDNAVLKACAGRSTDTILMSVDKLRGDVASNLRENIRRAGLGITFESRDVALTTMPPRQAKEAFDALNRATQKQDQMRNEALAYRIKTVKEAQSESEALTAAAESEKIRRVTEARAEAAIYVQRLKQFKKHPDLICRTIYEETLARVLANVEEKFIVSAKDGRQIRILLSRNPDKKTKAK